jgi:hypothetical protein
LVYVSKPVMYIYDLKEELNAWWLSPGLTKKIDTFNNIIVDRTPNIIQDPVSLYIKDSKYYITINVRDCVTLLYEISFANLFNFVKTNNHVGYHDNYIRDTIVNM